MREPAVAARKPAGAGSSKRRLRDHPAAGGRSLDHLAEGSGARESCRLSHILRHMQRLFY